MAEAGTIVGVEQRSQRFLTAGHPDFTANATRLRYATAKEVQPDTMIGRVPRSVCEHNMIQKRQTPYGMARVIPTTTVALEIALPSRKDVRREIKRILRGAGLRSR